jgi:putative peptidoglycan lipid II flippase
MNLLKTASMVSLFTLVSRITGLGREWVVASQFGASAWTDAFNVAFRIPNLLRRLFAEGAFSQAFVPILAASRHQQGDEATQHLIAAVATVLMWVVVLTSVLGVVASPIIVWVMASGLTALDTTVVMTRIMFPYIAFMTFVSLASAILNTWKRFALPAFTPTLLNLAVIGSALALRAPLQQWGIEPIYALCVGVMLGGLAQVGLQCWGLYRIGQLPRIALNWRGLRHAAGHPGVGRVIKQMAPAILGVSVAQLSLLINTQLASHQGAGAVSWLSYADRLMEFPTAMLGVALGVVLLPQLSAAQARGDDGAYSKMLDWGLRWVVLLGLPCALALLVLAQPLVSVLYHYGAFTPADVVQTARALMGYGVGLLGLVAIKILAPGFYARQDTRTPVKIAIGVLILTQLMNLVLVPWLGHAGLSLSIGLAAWVNAGCLFWGLKQSGAYRPESGWWAFITRIALACAVLAVALNWVAQNLDWIGLQVHWFWRLGCMSAVIVVSAALYMGLLRLLGLRLRTLLTMTELKDQTPSSISTVPPVSSSKAPEL